MPSIYTISFSCVSLSIFIFLKNEKIHMNFSERKIIRPDRENVDFVCRKIDYWVDAKVSADFLKNVFKRCSATMDAWFSCI